MSKETVKKFFEELAKSQPLREKFMTAMKESHEENVKKMTVTVVDFAKSSGFSFGENDLIELHAELMDSANDNGELSDDDLLKAAGGVSKGLLAGASVASVGLFCAVGSAVFEIRGGKGACKEFMKGD